MKNWFKKIIGIAKLEEEKAKLEAEKLEAEEATRKAKEEEELAKMTPKERATKRKGKSKQIYRERERVSECVCKPKKI